MKNTLAGLGIMAAAITFAACETTTNTNVNKALTNANGNLAVVVNANSNPVTNMNMGMNVNSNTKTSGVNYNATREEADKDKTNIQKEAEGLGSKIGTGANDYWIWLKTRGTLTAATDLRDSTINVDVDNAVVTLRGTVKDAAQSKKAAELAKTVSDVKDVKNSLQIKPNDSVVPGVGDTNTNSNAKAAPTKKG